MARRSIETSHRPAGLWEQSLLAKQAPRLLEDRIASIAGKSCSHKKARDTVTGFRGRRSARYT
ncbi:hypothetical protein DZG01_30215 [Pseudomonas fluorescens]|nr:hypothetical protein DZG01_30215 [Pseudomonas fluorescens]